jgi:uncharacterized membrane protein YebE (DUF533 family)
MKTKFIVPFILLFTVAAIQTNAQAIRKESRSERARIAQGTRNGELSKAERVRLSQEQKEIRKHMQAAKRNDGHIGPRERKHIRKEERKANRHIYRAKHS